LPGRNPLPLSVIIPVKNGRLCLDRCLEAVKNSDYSNFEIIVVNDGSTDNTPQIAARYADRYIHLASSLGPAGARNQGVRQASGEILVFVDADVVVQPHTLSLMAQDFADDAELAAVFGSYDDQPAWPTFLSQYKNLMHHYVHQISSEEAVSFWAGCGAMRKSVFEEFGGFDAARYPEPSIEDISLGHRMYFAGRKLRLDKRIQGKHLKRWTVRNLLHADIFGRAVPWSHLILESRQMPRDLNLTYASRFSAALVGALFAVLLLLALRLAGLKTIPPVAILLSLALIVVLLLALNWQVYQFFFRKRGFWFAAGVVPLHWLYYLYSSGTFAVCLAQHYFLKPLAAATRRAKSQA
jgi:glycosyltransferase involved in cell wall biosynthesis